MIEKLTTVDEAVRGIGAANTVVFDGAGSRLQHRLPGRHGQPGRGDGDSAEAAEKPLSGKTALVLGSGGAARRSPTAWSAAGRTCWSPTSPPARPRRWPSGSIAWPSTGPTATRSIRDILVNCTPVGMHPNVDETPYEKHHLRPSMVVFDAVYNPENTLLIKDARSRNCTVVTGVEMFVRQACLQFKLFTGQEGPADLMRDVIRRAIGAAKM